MRVWAVILVTAAAAAVAVSVLTIPGYLSAIGAARERMRSMGSSIAVTASGPIEYAERGEGPPVLVVHGVVGGYDQGLTVGRSAVGDGYRIIAPSRFGYQGTRAPRDRSPEAQADAHAALLDALGVRRVAVLGVSAGAPSSIQFAMRRPERTSALILEVPSTYMPDRPKDVQAIALPFILGVVLHTSLPVWAATKTSPSTVLATMGLPRSVQAGLEGSEKDELMQWLLPYEGRISGTLIDGRIAASLQRYDLETISVPTLLISAKDDLWQTYEPARYTARCIPGARFKGFDTGGHLLIGHEEAVRREVRGFLESTERW